MTPLNCKRKLEKIGENLFEPSCVIGSRLLNRCSPRHGRWPCRLDLRWRWLAHPWVHRLEVRLPGGLRRRRSRSTLMLSTTTSAWRPVMPSASSVCMGCRFFQTFHLSSRGKVRLKSTLSRRPRDQCQHRCSCSKKFQTYIPLLSPAAACPLRHCNPALVNLSEQAMPTYPSPFEYLVAFGLVFAAGVLTSVGLRQYTNKIRREAAAHA